MKKSKLTLTFIIFLLSVFAALVLSSCNEEPADCNCSFEVREKGKFTNYEWEVVAYGDYPNCIRPDSVVIYDTVLTVHQFPYQKIRVEKCE
jgi:hypothetical protein